jgi:hypothetical protein
MLVLALLACQEPFGTDRHDLVGYRIAAVAAPVDGGIVRPRAAIVHDGRLWSDEPVPMRWSWVSDPEEAPGELIAEGPAPEIPLQDGWLALEADFPDGTDVAVVEVESAEAVAIGAITLSTVELSVDDVTALQLAQDSRAGLDATAADFVPPGGFARLEAAVTGPEPMLRWMASGGAWFELDRTTADWAAGDLRVDDDEVIRGETLADGPVTVLALALGTTGNNDFHAREIWVGAPPEGFYTASQRWLASRVPGPVRAKLIADDAAPTGLALEEAVAVDPADLPDVDPYGTEALPCAVPVSGPFDPSWLADQRCARSQVVGATVVIE